MTRDVLIADDTDDMRMLLRTVLTAGDYNVVGEASDGNQALELWDELGEGSLAAVVLDQRMPGRTGIEVARRIIGDRPDQTVLICSAFVDEALRSATEELGVRLVPKSELLSLPDHLDGRLPGSEKS